jgi:uncharacterized membrane protein
MTVLGPLPGDAFAFVELVAATPDGLAYACNYSTGDGSRPARWTQAAGLELLPGPGGSEITGSAGPISADGRIVAGSYILGGKRTAFRWEEGRGLVNLVEGVPGLAESAAVASSADGSVIAGIASRTSGGSYAFRWSEAAGYQPLIDGDDGLVSFEAIHVSADGAVVVGILKNGAEARIFRWTEAAGIEFLSDPAPAGILTVQDITPDASVVVGYQDAPGGNIEAYRWTEAGGVETLIDPPLPDAASSSAQRVSADGRVIAGTRLVSSGFVWTEEEGAKEIPDGGFGGFVPLDLSADGGVVAGYGFPGDEDGTLALLWDAQHGTRSLNAELERHYALPLDGATLVAARFLSQDGAVIAGYGRDGLGVEFGFIARLDGCRDTQEVPVIAGAPSGPIETTAIVELDGSASTPGAGDQGGIISYGWELLSGPAEIDGEADAPVAVVRGTGFGTARIRLTVDDGHCANPASAETKIHFCTPLAAGNAEFLGLCDFPAADPSLPMEPRLSADGRVVVGFGLRPVRGAFTTAPVRWTRSGGAEFLGEAAGVASRWASDVSADGSVVVGPGEVSFGVEPFRWTSAEGVAMLGGGTDSPVLSQSRVVVSDDGTLVAWARDSVAYYWRREAGIQYFTSVPEGISQIDVLSASGDGSTLALVKDGLAFRAVAGEPLQALGDLPGGSVSSLPRDVSFDGSVVVGSSASANGIEAFRWVAGRGMRGLADLPGGEFASEALAVSGDGSVVVGKASSAKGREAFIWDAERGMRPLQEVLAAEHGLDLAGWRLEAAHGISRDGWTILGTGIAPSGIAAVWLVHRDLCGDPPERVRVAGAPSSPLSIAVPALLDGSASSAAPGEDRSITSYRWEIVSGPGAIDGPADEARAQIRGDSPGVVIVRLSVDDGGCGGLPASAEVEIPFRDPPPGNWLLCDSNGDSRVDVSDALATLGYLFLGTREPACLDSADCNRDGRGDVADPTYALSFLFLGGSAPEPPFPECGEFPGCADNCP